MLPCSRRDVGSALVFLSESFGLEVDELGREESGAVRWASLRATSAQLAMVEDGLDCDVWRIGVTPEALREWAGGSSKQSRRSAQPGRRHLRRAGQGERRLG